MSPSLKPAIAITKYDKEDNFYDMLYDNRQNDDSFASRSASKNISE